MLKSGEDILADIDATLDQLIRNAAAISEISISTLQENEMVAIQKTQESLLARLVHMNHLLDSEKKAAQMRKRPAYKIEEKIAEFGRLNSRLMEDMAIKFGKERKPKYVRKMRIHTKRRSYSLKAG